MPNRLPRQVNRLGDVLRQNIGLLLLGAAGVVGIASLLLTESPNPPAETIQVTLDAASTQSNLFVPTIAANLTQTPQFAALTAAAPTISLSGRQEVRQFAASAWASSQNDRVRGGAAQATGPPDVDGCTESASAYTPATVAQQAVLTLFFPQLVTPTGIQIYESFNPGYITRIEITDLYGEIHIVYESSPLARGDCTFPLVVRIEDADYQASAVTIYMDRTGSLYGWNQIDAVEMIGIRYN